MKINKILLDRRNKLIKLKIKYTCEYFNVHVMSKNISKIERCDKLIKKLCNEEL
jgi:hypothetical protein